MCSRKRGGKSLIVRQRIGLAEASRIFSPRKCKNLDESDLIARPNRSPIDLCNANGVKLSVPTGDMRPRSSDLRRCRARSKNDNGPTRRWGEPVPHKSYDLTIGP